MVDPHGQPLGANASPAIGDIFDNTGIDYVGSHQHHAKKATASGHLRCTITSVTATGGERATARSRSPAPCCFANHASLTLSDSTAPTVLSINGGTGIYRHAHGKIVATQRRNNTDFTIKVTY